jgi:hypothetical protein
MIEALRQGIIRSYAVALTSLETRGLGQRFERADRRAALSIYGHETSPPNFSASGSGRCRAAGRVALRVGASPSDAAGAHDCELSRRLRPRPRRAPRCSTVVRSALGCGSGGRNEGIRSEYAQVQAGKAHAVLRMEAGTLLHVFPFAD